MKYIVKKLLIFLATLFLVSIVTFVAFHIVPGDPAMMILGTEASEEKLEAMRERLGTNKPVVVQYTDWIGGIFHGDLGESIKYNQTVASLVKTRMEDDYRI